MGVAPDLITNVYNGTDTAKFQRTPEMAAECLVRYPLTPDACVPRSCRCHATCRVSCVVERAAECLARDPLTPDACVSRPTRTMHSADHLASTRPAVTDPSKHHVLSRVGSSDDHASRRRDAPFCTQCTARRPPVPSQSTRRAGAPPTHAPFYPYAAPRRGRPSIHIPAVCVRYVVGCIGSFEERKAQSVLLRAAKQLVDDGRVPNLHCLFVGEVGCRDVTMTRVSQKSSLLSVEPPLPLLRQGARQGETARAHRRGERPTTVVMAWRRHACGGAKEGTKKHRCVAPKRRDAPTPLPSARTCAAHSSASRSTRRSSTSRRSRSTYLR